MKIALIKIKQKYFDIEICDALTNLKKKEIIEIKYSNLNATNISKKNDQYFEAIFPEFVKSLNKAKETDLSLEFWRILIGPWFYKTIEFFNDKFYIIKKLPKDRKFIFHKTYFQKLRFHDIYDLYNDERFCKYSIFALNKFLKKNKINITLEKTRILNYKNKEVKNENNSFTNKFKYFLRKIFYYLTLRKKYNFKILNINSALLSNELKNLSDKNNNLSDNFLSLVKLNNIPYLNKDKRISIDKKFNEEFLDSFKNLINDWLPIEYGEEFNSNLFFYKKQIIENNPKFIIVRSPHETNVQIRFLIALFKEYKKSKIISFQEGGIGKFYYQENYENYFLIGTDVFLQWSNLKNKKNIYNFYLTKTFWKKEYNIPKNEKILLILGSMRKIFFSYHEGHLPDYSFVQLQQINNLLLNKKIFNRSKIRFHKNFGFNEKKYLQKKFKNLDISTREEVPYFYDLLSKFSLKIFFSDYTANMQSIIINHPTILIYDRYKLKNNKKYSHIYNELYSNNILFYSVEELIKFINQHLTTHEEILKWWFSSNVQKARKKYLSSICRITDRIDKEFINTINKMI